MQVINKVLRHSMKVIFQLKTYLKTQLDHLHLSPKPVIILNVNSVNLMRQYIFSNKMYTVRNI